MSQLKLNFQHVRTVVVDRDPFIRSLIAQMLRGFGMTGIESLGSASEALAMIKEKHVDLCVIEAGLSDMSGTDLLRLIRREDKDAIRHVPVLMLTGYSQNAEISAARDAGANMVVKKPLSPRLLYDRLAWIARSTRAFVETDDFIGPDRRFREIAPPAGQYRRSSDATQAQRDTGVA